MIKGIKIIFLAFLFVIPMVFSTQAVLALGQTEITLLPAIAETKIGEASTFDLFVNTGSDKIYSFSLTITYPTDKLSFSGFVNDYSLVSDWVKQEEKEGLISLIGGIGKGFTGQGKIIGFKFTPKLSGEATILLVGENLILNQNQKNILSKTSPATVKITGVAGPSPTIPTPTGTVSKQSKFSPLLLLPIPIFLITLLGFIVYRKQQKPSSPPSEEFFAPKPSQENQEVNSPPVTPPEKPPENPPQSPVTP